ncbi:hypothetical protein [Pricia sp.]|uniref:hypothetical protein n=1 Tax=Pricia sp. TaxID=2268138 RepID=UPI003593E953
MKILKAIASKLTMAIILIFSLSCGSGNPDFEGEWVCKSDKMNTIGINKIGEKTYELDFGNNMVLSGEVNNDGVLAVEMLGNVSRFSISKGELRFSGVFADNCADYIKQ